MSEVTVKEAMMENEVKALESMIEDAKVEAKKGALLTMEPVKPVRGGFIKPEPFKLQPVLDRIGILSEIYQDFEARINQTDRSMITDQEVSAFNGIAKAFEDAQATLKGLIG